MFLMLTLGLDSLGYFKVLIAQQNFGPALAKKGISSLIFSLLTIEGVGRMVVGNLYKWEHCNLPLKFSADLMDRNVLVYVCIYTY